ncbi:Conserved membrane protein YqhR [Desulfotomaculum arcticum]|uniref:Conserved membrane protein YqhR n=1 Tax=Desulfotruncus arcticus DSM 17038 TaxID=1121424 RepID=A0A1I2YW95_9FIRM|nr:YqhR family membrane protein [Desulfotruncus arcticus]SFH29943.1 Conserved membrane protein YqhR [Desulfotomaculum arcticum] [Desulfotruncus arcticus DSM 17038]
MILQDRTTRGFIAGVLGGIVMNIISYISYYLNIANLRFLDWPSIIITGHSPTNALQAIFFFLIQLIFVGFLGIIFAYLVSKLVTSINYIFKGFLFAVLSWFAIYSLTYIADVPKLTPLTMGTAVTDFIGALVFGFVVSETLNRFDAREEMS